MTSLMLEETRCAPDRVAEMLASDGDAYAALAAELRLRDPAFVVTVARGSSDHAALYLASLVGILAGRITASLPPSLVTRYQATLSLRRRLRGLPVAVGCEPGHRAHAGGGWRGWRHHRRHRQPARTRRSLARRCIRCRSMPAPSGAWRRPRA